MYSLLPPPSASQAAGGFRILVLEHHSMLAGVLRRHLAAQGHEVEIASSLAGAWVAMGARPFDVLLSDVCLPQGSCLNLLQGEHPRLPPFVATMSAFDLAYETLRDFSIRRHLAKPFDPEELDALLEEWTNERALQALPNERSGW